MKSLLFKVDYGQELRMGFEIRKKKVYESRGVCEKNEENV